MKIILWLSVLLVSAILYWYWGASDQLLKAYKVNTEVQKIKTEISKTGSIDVLIHKMEKRVAESPNDAQGQFLLAKLYMSDQKMDRAISCFEKANSLKANDPDIMVNYAQALYFKNNRNLDAKSKVLIDKVLKLDMQNVNALNLLAIDAYNHQDYEKAIQYWERVLIQLPLNSDDAKQIEMMISKAKNQR